jgi:nitrite reductase/ring-hydroxylating ferredoxin subunit
MEWHKLGTVDDLLARVPCSFDLARHKVALFRHDGAFHAIGNACNHKGGRWRRAGATRNASALRQWPALRKSS